MSNPLTHQANALEPTNAPMNTITIIDRTNFFSTSIIASRAKSIDEAITHVNTLGGG